MDHPREEFESHLNQPMKRKEEKEAAVGIATANEKMTREQDELSRQLEFAQRDPELLDLLGSSMQELETHQVTHPKPAGSNEMNLSGTGAEVGDLLGEMSFGASFGTKSNEAKDLLGNPAAGGDTQTYFGNTSELLHDFDYFGKESPLSSDRLDQVSPPRSPFMELDKSSLSDDFALEDPKVVMRPSAPEPTAEMLSGSEGFGNIKTDYSFQALAPQTFSGFELSASLDDVQPPDFYESPISSIAKEAPTKSSSDSQVLEPDDIEEYLPKDPVDSFSTASTISAASAEFRKELESQKVATNNILTETITEFTSITFTTSPDIGTQSKGAGFEMYESKEEKIETDGKESPYNFYTKEPMFVLEESIPFDQVVPTSSSEEQDQLFGHSDKTKKPFPASHVGEHLDDDHLRQFEVKHAELTTFLQERDPSSALDDYDRSDDSISPNPVTTAKYNPADAKQDAYGFAYKEYPDHTKEPIMEAVKVGPTESHAFSTRQQTTPFGFEHVQFEEKESPESIDDYEFEVIPPKVPPHKYPLDEPSKVTKGVESVDDFYNAPVKSAIHETKEVSPPTLPPRDLYDVGEPIGLCHTPPPSASALEKKAEQAAEAQKKVEEEELVPFLPKESFETIPPVYQPAKEITPKAVTQPAKSVEEKTKAPIRKLSSGSEPKISEEAQKILNIFNPKAWFDPNKLHPTVSELVYWRDPKKSGIVFGGIFVILISLTFLSFISVVAYTSLAILSGTFAFRVYKNVLQTVQKTQEGHPFKEYLEQELTLENDKTQEICNAVISHLNKVAIQLRHLFLVEDLMDSAKFGGFLYFLTYLGSWFNGLTLLILAFLALFGLPKVYELNKNVVDQYMDLICAKVSEITTKIHDVLPFGKKEKAQ